MSFEPSPWRWAAPSRERCHPRLALVRHAGRLYSFAELLMHLTPDERLPLDISDSVAQDVWDDIIERTPEAATRAARLCEPRDFEVLDLYACEAMGSA